MVKTLAKLLKEKNVLVGRMNELRTRIARENVTEGFNEAKYKVQDLYTELQVVTEHLITVKSAISRLNVPVVDKIYRMGELKSRIQFLKGLNTQDGTFTESDRWVNSGAAVAKTYKAQMSRVDVDREVETLTEAINLLQEELDTFNYSTTVDM